MTVEDLHPRPRAAVIPGWLHRLRATTRARHAARSRAGGERARALYERLDRADALRTAAERVRFWF